MAKHAHTVNRGDLDDAQFLEDRLYDFNAAQTGRDDGRYFTFVIRDEMGQIIAGTSGWTWASACEVRTLWVDGAWRGQGLGERLLATVEAEASVRGCQIVLLASYSFQAPAFYQRHGYNLVWQLADFPPGHQFNFLVKQLPAGSEGANEAARPA